MALLSTLVSTVAAVEGIDEGQVTWVARHLREAGLITQAGRGRGAAHMTSKDAANILIGVNASASAKEAVKTVGEFRDLICNYSAVKIQFFEKSFAKGISFGDSLEMLIEAAIPDDFGSVSIRWELLFGSDYIDRLGERPFSVERYANDYRDHAHYIDQIVRTKIEFDRQDEIVNLIFENTGLFFKGGPAFPPAVDEDEREKREIINVIFSHKFFRPKRLGDRKDRVAISINTILAVGETLAA